MFFSLMNKCFHSGGKRFPDKMFLINLIKNKVSREQGKEQKAASSDLMLESSDMGYKIVQLLFSKNEDQA